MACCSDLVTWIPPVEARQVAVVIFHYEWLGHVRRDLN